MIAISLAGLIQQGNLSQESKKLFANLKKNGKLEITRNQIKDFDGMTWDRIINSLTFSLNRVEIGKKYVFWSWHKIQKSKIAGQFML